jgi:hypothetical protein
MPEILFPNKIFYFWCCFHTSSACKLTDVLCLQIGSTNYASSLHVQ